MLTRVVCTLSPKVKEKREKQARKEVIGKEECLPPRSTCRERLKARERITGNNGGRKHRRRPRGQNINTNFLRTNKNGHKRDSHQNKANHQMH